MNYGILLFEVPQQLRDMIRSLEKEKKKLIKTEWSTKFNISCLNENLLPKHTNIPCNVYVFGLSNQYS